MRDYRVSPGGRTLGGMTQSALQTAAAALGLTLPDQLVAAVGAEVDLHLTLIKAIDRDAAVIVISLPDGPEAVSVAIQDGEIHSVTVRDAHCRVVGVASLLDGLTLAAELVRAREAQERAN